MGFSALLQSFSGFFSRSFWFSRFLPVALIAVTHELLGRWLLGWRFEAGISGILQSDMGMTLLSFVGLVVLAYALSPLIPLIGAMLDGSILPEWLHNRLRDERRAAWKKAKGRPEPAYAALLALKDQQEKWDEALREAAAAGNQAGTATDERALKAAARAIAAFEKIPSAPVGPLLDSLTGTGEALEAALKANSSMLADSTVSDQVDALHTRFRDLLDELVNEAAHQVVAAENRLGVTDAVDFQPTRFGDARQLLQRYAKKTYGVPLDYLWPRVRLAILSGEENNATGTPRVVADAMAQVEFAVFLFALWWTIPLVWLPLILASHDAIASDSALWAFLAIGLAAPLVGKALYELAVEAEIVAGRSIATALDRYHRAALKDLGFDPPDTLSAERQLWSKLYQSRQPNIDLTFAKTAAPEG